LLFAIKKSFVIINELQVIYKNMEKSPIVEIAKRVCPSVITVIASKDLPNVDGYYTFPLGEREYLLPKIKDNKTKMQKVGGGSAFIISKEGYIITSNHVVSDSEAEYTVILEPEEKYLARVLSRNPINDIAILKIEGDNFPYLELGDSDKILLGEGVLSIGNALGEFHDTLSAGIISGLSRYINPSINFLKETETLKGLIQTDAAINPGNSGGPLVNMEGKVIGVNTASITGTQNMGFAIPINYAKKDIEEVKKYGKIKRPFLGVKYIILNEEIAKKNKLTVSYGALVVRERFGESPIIENSSAEKSGIKEFDIILSIGGEKINIDNSLSEIISRQKIGEKIELIILRNGKKIKKEIKLEEKK